MPAKSKREHSCGLLFLSPGKFYVNVKCFERVNTDGDQPFRNRAHVIKESPSNRRSRSSRTDSFTDSLLLRQRSQSTPLAQFSYSLLIDVREDPDTIIEEIDAGVDPRVSGNDLQRKTSVAVENTCLKEKEDSVLEKDSSEPVKDCNEESTVTRIENKEEPVSEDKKAESCNGSNIAQVEISGEITMAGELHSVHVDQTCSDPENTSIDNNTSSFESQGKEVPNKSVEVSHAGNIIVEDLVIKPEDMTQSIIDVEDIDIDVQHEETVDHDVCQGTKFQEIESNFQENCLSDEDIESAGVEAKLKATVKNKIRTDELTLQDKLSKEETTKVERTDASNDEIQETVASPSVKQRIMFFNSA